MKVIVRFFLLFFLFAVSRSGFTHTHMTGETLACFAKPAQYPIHDKVKLKAIEIVEEDDDDESGSLKKKVADATNYFSSPHYPLSAERLIYYLNNAPLFRKSTLFISPDRYLLHKVFRI